jgi:alanine dehydrogenase
MPRVHSTPTMVLTRKDVAGLLSLDECIEAVERALRLYGEGRTAPPGVLGMHVDGGGFHVKAATLELSRPYFAAKLNANFPGNRARFNLPTIQGVIALCDATNGALLALMDSIEITTLRTGAATAVAAKHLARPDASVMTVCGCGSQGAVSVRAIARVRPIDTVFMWDIDADRAAEAVRLLGDLDVRVAAVEEWRGAARQSDILATCTTSTRAFVREADVRPGTFIAAVGADHPDKHEIDPALMAAAAVVTDVTSQCAAFGDLHHAIATGRMTVSDVRAELGAVVAGRIVGRRRDEEITIFDSTGTALLDVAAAVVVYEKALARGHLTSISLGCPATREP